jgi:hypothetical protein
MFKILLKYEIYMHYHNATCFCHIRPSSGNTFMRSLMHCALIKYHSFSYVVLFMSFLEMRLFLLFLCCVIFLMCASSASLLCLCSQLRSFIQKFFPSPRAFVTLCNIVISDGCELSHAQGLSWRPPFVGCPRQITQYIWSYAPCRGDKRHE